MKMEYIVFWFLHHFVHSHTDHTAAGEDYESQLEEHGFSSGYEYICSIKQDGESPGISTVEDSCFHPFNQRRSL